VLERTNDELLDPLIDRAFMLADAAGLLPESAAVPDFRKEIRNGSCRRRRLRVNQLGRWRD